MRKWFVNSKGIWENGYSFIRIFIGLTLIYHGQEVFNQKQMADYAKWLTDVNFFAPALMAYLGKGSEFVGGVFLTLGLYVNNLVM